MTRLAPWLNFLDNSGVRYSHSIHPPAQTAIATADAERVSPAEFAKCVVYRSDAGFGMAVVPSDEYVDLKKLAGVLGASHLTLATEREMADLFPDCEIGAMPPFGNVYRMPVVVDYDVALNEFVAFTIGTHRDAVRMSFEDYRRLARPIVSSIAAASEMLT